MKTRIRVVFTGLAKDTPTWPHINYDVDRRAETVMAMLTEALPEIEFSPVVYQTREQAMTGYEENEKGQYDGWLVYIAAIWNRIPGFYVENVHPVVVADELYSGSGEF
jgi:hypothetical protein